MSDEEAIETGPNYQRNSRGQFVKGSAPGPGRLPRQQLRKYLEAVKPLVPSRGQMASGLQLLNAGAPGAATRLLDIAMRSKNESNALKAIELIIAHTHGTPLARSLVGTASMDVLGSSPAERQERLRNLLERVAQVCGPQAIPTGAVIDRPLDDPRGNDVG